MLSADNWPIGFPRLYLAETPEQLGEGVSNVVMDYASLLPQLYSFFHPGKTNILSHKPCRFETKSEQTNLHGNDVFSVCDVPEAYSTIVYDCLDHCDDPVELMSKVVKSTEFAIFIRFHPYASRLGTNDFAGNLAYRHLTTECGIFTHKLTNPIDTYIKWLKAAEIDIWYVNPVRMPVEPIFNDISQGLDLSLQFLDVVGTKKRRKSRLIFSK